MNNLDNLGFAQLKLNGLNINQPNSAEATRLKFIVSDILSNLTEEEVATHFKNSNTTKSSKEIAAEQAAIIAQMNENRDKPSI